MTSDKIDYIPRFISCFRPDSILGNYYSFIIMKYEMHINRDKR